MWGFAATWHTDRDAVAQAARDAVAIAKANARIVGRKVTLAPTAKAVGKWSSPFEIDPFDVPLGERVEALLGRRARRPGAKSRRSSRCKARSAG